MTSNGRPVGSRTLAMATRASQTDSEQGTFSQLKTTLRSPHSSTRSYLEWIFATFDRPIESQRRRARALAEAQSNLEPCAAWDVVFEERLEVGGAGVEVHLLLLPQQRLWEKPILASLRSTSPVPMCSNLGQPASDVKAVARIWAVSSGVGLERATMRPALLLVVPS